MPPCQPCCPTNKSTNLNSLNGPSGLVALPFPQPAFSACPQMPSWGPASPCADSWRCTIHPLYTSSFGHNGACTAFGSILALSSPLPPPNLHLYQLPPPFVQLCRLCVTPARPCTIDRKTRNRVAGAGQYGCNALLGGMRGPKEASGVFVKLVQGRAVGWKCEEVSLRGEGGGCAAHLLPQPADGVGRGHTPHGTLAGLPS